MAEQQPTTRAITIWLPVILLAVLALVWLGSQNRTGERTSSEDPTLPSSPPTTLTVAPTTLALPDRGGEAQSESPSLGVELPTAPPLPSAYPPRPAAITPLPYPIATPLLPTAYPDPGG
jgi:hypothetical protein